MKNGQAIVSGIVTQRSAPVFQIANYKLQITNCSPVDRYNSRMDRVAMLKGFLAENPNDSFARYGLAMEYSRAGNTAAALAEFEAIAAADPDYVPSYQMAGQMLLAAGRDEEARHWLTQGIAAARRSGDLHAISEMQGLLESLPD
jgi:tetratricopeptide (TPR) repeat protein